MLEVRALEQVVQTANAIPTIPIAFERHDVLPVLLHMAMVRAQNVDEHLAGRVLESGGELDLVRIAREIVERASR